MGHVRMMGAIQPFLCGAISKTVNMPEAATAEEIEQVYLEGWKLGLKAIAIYRDNSKRSQPLSTGKKKDSDAARRHGGRGAAQEAARGGPGRGGQAASPPPAGRADARSRTSSTSAATRATSRSGCIPDGQPGEIFLKMAKEGSTVSGLMDSFATTVSVALQYGVPLRDLVNKFAHVRFEPSGFTGNQEIPIAKSIVDYIFRWLGSRFLSPDDRASLGLIDRSAVVDEPPAVRRRALGVRAARRTRAGAREPALRGRGSCARRRRRAAARAEAGRGSAQGDRRRHGVSGRGRRGRVRRSIASGNGHTNGMPTATGMGMATGRRPRRSR